LCLELPLWDFRCAAINNELPERFVLFQQKLNVFEFFLAFHEFYFYYWPFFDSRILVPFGSIGKTVRIRHSPATVMGYENRIC